MFADFEMHLCMPHHPLQRAQRAHHYLQRSQFHLKKCDIPSRKVEEVVASGSMVDAADEIACGREVNSLHKPKTNLGLEGVGKKEVPIFLFLVACFSNVSMHFLFILMISILLCFRFSIFLFIVLLMFSSMCFGFFFSKNGSLSSSY